MDFTDPMVMKGGTEGQDSNKGNTTIHKYLDNTTKIIRLLELQTT